MRLAGQALLDSPAPYKHLRILTDSANSSGIEPRTPSISSSATPRKYIPLFVHVITLGANPSVFTTQKHALSFWSAP